MRMSVLTKSMERLRKAADQGYIQHEDLNILVAEADKHDVTASAMFNDQELRTAKLESAFRRLAQEYHQTLQDERGNDTAVIQYHMSERFEDCPQCKSNADVLS